MHDSSRVAQTFLSVRGFVFAAGVRDFVFATRVVFAAGVRFAAAPRHFKECRFAGAPWRLKDIAAPRRSNKSEARPPLIPRRPLDMINHEALYRAFYRFQFKSNLLLDRIEQSRTTGI